MKRHNSPPVTPDTSNLGAALCCAVLCCVVCARPPPGLLSRQIGQLPAEVVFECRSSGRTRGIGQTGQADGFLSDSVRR